MILKIHQVAANCHFLRFNQFFGPLYMPIRQLFNTIIYKMLIWFRRRRGKNPYLKISTGYQMSVKLILKIHQVAANCHFLRFNQFFGPLYMPIRQLFNTIIYKMLIWFRRRRGKNPYLKISTGYQMSVKLILKIHQVANPTVVQHNNIQNLNLIQATKGKNPYLKISTGYQMSVKLRYSMFDNKA